MRCQPMHLSLGWPSYADPRATRAAFAAPGAIAWIAISEEQVVGLAHMGLGNHDKVLAVVRDVAATVEAEHGAARVLTNLGVYQDSKHLHFHVNFGEPLR